MNTCGSCRFFEALPDEEAVHWRLRGYRVPEGMGHCGWTPREVLVLPKAFTMQIKPMHKDDVEDCARFLAGEGEEPGTPAKVLSFPRAKTDVEDLIS